MKFWRMLYLIAKITSDMVNDAILQPPQVEICNVLCVPRQFPTNFFLPNKSGIRAVSGERLGPILLGYLSPTLCSCSELKTCPQPRRPNVNIWPSYKFHSSLVSLCDHPLISNLINLFYSPSLLVSDLFKSYFRLPKIQISRLPQKHVTYPSYTQFFPIFIL